MHKHTLNIEYYELGSGGVTNLPKLHWRGTFHQIPVEGTQIWPVQNLKSSMDLWF